MKEVMNEINVLQVMFLMLQLELHSHDEYIDFFAKRDELLSDVRKEFGKNEHWRDDHARSRESGSAPSATGGGHSEK